MKKYIKQIDEHIEKMRSFNMSLTKDLQRDERARRFAKESLKMLNEAKNDRTNDVMGFQIFSIFSGLLARVELDTLKIKIKNSEYKIESFSQIFEVAKDRKMYLKNLDENGIELSDEMKRSLENDLIGTLIEDELSFKNEPKDGSDFKQKYKSFIDKMKKREDFEFEN